MTKNRVPVGIGVGTYGPAHLGPVHALAFVLFRFLGFAVVADGPHDFAITGGAGLP